MDNLLTSRRNAGTTLMKKRTIRRRMQPTRKRRKLDLYCTTIMEENPEVELSDDEDTISMTTIREMGTHYLVLKWKVKIFGTAEKVLDKVMGKLCLKMHYQHLV